MRVFVNWDTDGYSVEELGLSTLVDIPTMNEEDIADYLSDEFGYCVESFDIIELDSGCYNGENAWVLEDDGSEMILLIGDYTLDVALKAKEKYDNEQSEEYDECIVWCDSEEWLKKQNGCKIVSENDDIVFLSKTDNDNNENNNKIANLNKMVNCCQRGIER